MTPANQEVSRRGARVLLAAIVIFGIGIRFALLPDSIARTPDERVYAHQASMVQAQGEAGFATLGAELERDPAGTALYPSPLRAGWIAVLASAANWIGEDPMTAGSVLSFVCSAASLLLLAWIGLRFFTAVTACAATLLLAVSPFDLVIYQRAWQESFCSLLGLATVAIVLYAGISSGVRRRLWLAALVIAGVLACTVKENCAIFFALCGAGLVLHLWLKGEKRDALLTAAAMVGAAVASLALLSLLYGGPAHYAALYRLYAGLRGSNSYSEQYESGPAWLIGAGLWRSSSTLCLCVGTGLVLACRNAWRRREPDEVTLAAASAATVVFVLSLPVLLTLNFRFDAPAFAVLCLLGGIGFSHLLVALQLWAGPARSRFVWGVCGLALTLGAARDLHFAHEAFLKPAIPDLSVRMVLEAGTKP